MSRPLLLVTCRVDVRVEVGETRDAVDQHLSSLLAEAGALPVLAPNLPSVALETFERLRPDGLVLSGGNDLTSVGGDRVERDETERTLLAAALRHRVPVLGICRGAQLLCEELGGALDRVDGHVRARHEIFDAAGRSLREVNSYHAFALRAVPPGFEVVAQAGDGSIEWMRANDRRVQAVMWHPEREPPPRPEDLAFLREHFGLA